MLGLFRYIEVLYSLITIEWKSGNPLKCSLNQSGTIQILSVFVASLNEMENVPQY